MMLYVLRTIGVMAHTLGEALTDKQRADGSPPDHVPAAQLGVSAPTYNRWKRGDMVPHESAALAIAAYLELAVEEVYLLLARSRVARNTVTPPDPPVTRAEFDTLASKFEELMRRLDDVTEPPRAPDSITTDRPGGSRRRPEPSTREPHDP